MRSRVVGLFFAVFMARVMAGQAAPTVGVELFDMADAPIRGSLDSGTNFKVKITITGVKLPLTGVPECNATLSLKQDEVIKIPKSLAGQVIDTVSKSYPNQAMTQTPNTTTFSVTITVTADGSGTADPNDPKRAFQSGTEKITLDPPDNRTATLVWEKMKLSGTVTCNTSPTITVPFTHDYSIAPKK